jgi:NAD(P)-dependent dehydrogenase (short-subunit alcohol dehydrogenase family)
MDGKTVVITGASSGIGLETARALAQKGATIVMVVRSKERGEAAIADIVKTAPNARLSLVLADLYSLAEVRRAGAELRALPRIDVLINNAGFEKTFALNHLAPFLLTYELRDKLAASAPARVVTVSSNGHRMAQLSWDTVATRERWPGQTLVYGASKLCNIWFAREAARRFAGKGVTSSSLHPGPVASAFGQSGSRLFQLGVKLARPLLLSTEEGARTSVYLASSPEVEGVSGSYFVKCKATAPSRRARDDDSARTLWELSERLCGVRWS